MFDHPFIVSCARGWQCPRPFNLSPYKASTRFCRKSLYASRRYRRCLIYIASVRDKSSSSPVKVASFKFQTSRTIHHQVYTHLRVQRSNRCTAMEAFQGRRPIATSPRSSICAQMFRRATSDQAAFRKPNQMMAVQFRTLCDVSVPLKIMQGGSWQMRRPTNHYSFVKLKRGSSSTTAINTSCNPSPNKITRQSVHRTAIWSPCRCGESGEQRPFASTCLIPLQERWPGSLLRYRTWDRDGKSSRQCGRSLQWRQCR
jgi:hypothetical protein